MLQKPETESREVKNRQGLVWSAARRALKRKKVQSDAPLVESVDAVKSEVDQVITARRKLLESKLKVSLKRFRSEVMEEVETQADEAKQRQERLMERQSLIVESLTGLREDILDEIDARAEGVLRGGRLLESSLRDFRAEWEAEVNALIEEAQQDVNLAVSDIEVVLKEQREEWERSVELFEEQWQRTNSVTGRNATGRNATGTDGRVLIFERAEIQTIVDEVSREIEDELALAKERWSLTKKRLEGVPKQLGVASWEELPRRRSLAEVRAYVSETVFSGTSADSVLRSGAKMGGRGWRRRDGQRGQLAWRRPDGSPIEDPLGLRQAADDPVLVPTAASNLRAPGRLLHVVTTAALPWMTGTSINPLLRAAHLAKAGYDVALYMPWLADAADQERLFPPELRFERPAQQERYVRWWLENRANVADCDGLKIRWYAAEYKEFIGCVLQRDLDIIQAVPEAERDVVILEEPEHINWYHHGPQWTREFEHVVGVAHTNYLQYAGLNSKGGSSGEVKAKVTELMNNIVVAAHTDVVIRLSATLPPLPGYDYVCNVHGVRAEFLAVGAAAAKQGGEAAFPRGAYFLGKALWTKGYCELLDHLELHAAADRPAVDTFGSGKEQAEIADAVTRRALPVRVHDGIDHAHPSLHGYRVFVNPSTSDVLCTATAEALAMGKKVLIPEHPSNTFFRQFSNAVFYEHAHELVPLLREALRTPPQPMSPREQYMLSWEAATERLLDAAALPEGAPRTNERPLHALAYGAHWCMGVQPVYNAIRIATCAGPVTPGSR